METWSNLFQTYDFMVFESPHLTTHQSNISVQLKQETS